MTTFDTVSAMHIAAMFQPARGAIAATCGSESGYVLWDVGNMEPLADIKTDEYRMTYAATSFPTMRKGSTAVVTGKGTFKVITVDQIDDGAAKMARLSKVS